MENFTSNNTSMDSNISTRTETTNCDETLQQIFWFVNGVLALIILTGNAFTCAIFLSTKQLRQQYMNTFLVSLAVSDILMAVMVVPGYTSFCAGCKYLSTDTCWILAQTKDLVFSSSFFSLLAITYDRYLAVLCPLQYGCRMTRNKVTCMVLAIWILPALIASARNIWWLTMPEEDAKAINKVYNVILVFLLVMLPAMIMALVNALIVRAIQTQKRKTLPLRELSSVNQEISGEETRAETSRKRRGTIACVAVVLVFVLSWIPRSVYNFAFVFGRADLVTPLLVKLSMFFLLLQSCVNPLIYSFYRADFRQAAKRLLKHSK
ncbi:alpha-2B adrenergic receptor-like [Orbicella faveolata]|uniref:alpha-2B adrenergic receptor-like n=1 Tax=Orbicella faveolata TaxID=48498 RepID=UPI0009E32352|nr:alpha-2B adrenergic receptor-like [Orbicella faveolata]